MKLALTLALAVVTLSLTGCESSSYYGKGSAARPFIEKLLQHLGF